MARSFKGVDDYVEAASSSTTNMGVSDFSVSFWSRTTVTPGINERLFCKGNSGGGTGGGVRYELAITTGASLLTFIIDDAVLKREASVALPSTFTTGVWNHFICERNESVSIKLFHGGTEIASGSDGVGNIDVSLGLVVGAGRESGDAVGGFMDIEIGNFSIIKGLYTADEKTALANGMSPMLMGIKPVIFAPLGFGDPDPDYSGNANNMTLTNAPPPIDSPPVQSPFGMDYGYLGNLAGSAAGLSIPVAMSSYRRSFQAGLG